MSQWKFGTLPLSAALIFLSMRAMPRDRVQLQACRPQDQPGSSDISWRHFSGCARVAVRSAHDERTATVPRCARVSARRSHSPSLLLLQLSIISADMFTRAKSDHRRGVLLSDVATIVFFERSRRDSHRATAVHLELLPRTADPEGLLCCGKMICLSYPKHLCPARLPKRYC